MTKQVIPAEAVEAAAGYLPHSDDCETRSERDCTCWQLRVNIMRAALEAAAPHMLADAQSVAWEHCAKKAEAATKLAAPDHITPMGARVIRKSIEANPYRIAK